MGKGSWTNRRFRGLYERGIEQTGEARSRADALRRRGETESRKAIAGQDRLAGQLGEDVQARRGLVDRLEAQSRGEGPSLAEAQMRQSQDRSLAQQLAAAGRTRGSGGAAAQRQLMRSQQAAARDIAQQSAVTRMQEQQAAQQQLGSLASQSQQQLGAQLAARQALGSQQDLAAQQLARQINQQQFEAQRAAVAGRGAHSMGRRGAELTQRGQDIGLMGAGLKAGGTALAAFAPSDKNQKKNIKIESKNDNTNKKDNEKEDKKKESIKSAISGLGSGIEDVASTSKSEGRAMMRQAQAQLSDKNKKESVSYSDKNKKSNKDSMNSKDFLDKLKAYSYEYKNPSMPGAGEGRHFSVMAQDLEKAGKIGKSMVKNTEYGKMVDYGKGFGSILAAQVQLNERLKELEKKKKKS